MKVKFILPFVVFTAVVAPVVVRAMNGPNEENFIIGGTQAKKRQYPFFVQPMFTDADGAGYICGGKVNKVNLKNQ